MIQTNYEQFDEVAEWCKKNNINYDYEYDNGKKRTKINPVTFEPVGLIVNWIIPDEKERMLFMLKWGNK